MARSKPLLQRLVRTDPVTGRKSLYLSSHAGGLVGWPVPEARGFLRDLIEHVAQRQYVYSHIRAVGDLVMWDNRQTMHRGRPFPVHEVLLFLAAGIASQSRDQPIWYRVGRSVANPNGTRSHIGALGKGISRNLHHFKT